MLVASGARLVTTKLEKLSYQSNREDSFTKPEKLSYQSNSEANMSPMWSH